MRLAQILLVSGLLILTYFGIARGIEAIRFNRNVEGYLKRAADANTVELAEKNLTIALNNLVNTPRGYTSIIYTTPDEDVGFWLDNLRASQKELKQLPANTTALEKSNTLIKLRETLLDGGEHGVYVTVPPGISIFPANTLFAIWGTIGTVLFLLGIALFAVLL